MSANDKLHFWMPYPTGRDGEPIRVGDTVYGSDGRAWKVDAIGAGKYPVISVDGELCGHETIKRLKPEWLSHKRSELAEVVRCAECAKADRLEGGAIVCKRFGAFYHKTDPQGYCHEGRGKA